MTVIIAIRARVHRYVCNARAFWMFGRAGIEMGKYSLLGGNYSEMGTGGEKIYEFMTTMDKINESDYSAILRDTKAHRFPFHMIPINEKSRLAIRKTSRLCKLLGISRCLSTGKKRSSWETPKALFKSMLHFSDCNWQKCRTGVWVIKSIGLEMQRIELTAE